MIMAKTILITGGAGFIGANLVRELINQGTDPLCIHIITEKNTNLWRLTSQAQLPIIHEMNLENFAGIRSLVHSIRPHIIFHLASYGGFPDQNDQKTIFNVNFLGTVNLLNACKENGFNCFINTGSSSEYGRKNEPLKESMMPEPVSDYAVAKVAATQYCLKESLFYSLPIYTIRPFSVYGDYEMPTRLIPSLLIGGLQSQPIKLSAPHYVRDYIYVQDLVSLFLAVAEKRPQNSFIFNGGSGVQSSILDVLTTAQGLFSHDLHGIWNSQTPRPWEPTTWVADGSTSLHVLDWQPRHTLAQGLEKSLAWYRNNISLYAHFESLKHAQQHNAQS